jgi:predicted metal-dependent phosphotriesterase family hydrolase
MWIGTDNVRQGTSPEKFELLKAVMSLGYGHKVLLSQDYEFLTHANQTAGDHPCTVIFDEFMPYCAANGIDQQKITHMMTENLSNFYDIEMAIG